MYRVGEKSLANFSVVFVFLLWTFYLNGQIFRMSNILLYKIRIFNETRGITEIAEINENSIIYYI